MKLIIDIDDEMVCNDIKNKALEPTSETDEVIINALYNGTPVTTYGDLISRSELKREFAKFDRIYIADTGNELVNAFAVDKLIDNAPTVEIPNYSGQVVPDMLRGWRYEERPQGEWITTRTMVHDGNPYCSICDEENIIRTNFCPNCGADMRGKEE